MRRGVVVGFAMLCLLSGSAWIGDGYAPGMLSGPLRMTVHFGFLTAMFWACDGILRRGREVHAVLRVWVQVALWGAALFALPQVVFAVTDGRVARLTEVLVFTLVPVMVVLIEAQHAEVFGLGENGMQRMVPALAGFGGVEMLLPMVLPSSGAGMVWLAAEGVAAILAAMAAVRLHRLCKTDLLRAAGTLKVASVVCGSSAIVTALFCWTGWVAAGEITRPGIAQEVLRCLLLDGPVALLTVWLLGRMRPVAFAVRYLLVPLVTVAEGYVWLRPQTHWTMIAGALLVVGGSAMLLVSNEHTLLAD